MLWYCWNSVLEMHGWFTYGNDVFGSKLIYAKETEDYEDDVKEICQDRGPHEPQEVKHLAFDNGKLKKGKQQTIIRFSIINIMILWFQKTEGDVVYCLLRYARN